MKDLHVDSYLYDTIYIRFLGRIFWLHSTPCSRPRGGDTHLLEEWQGVIRSLPSIWYISTRTTLGYFLCQFWYQINWRESVLSWYFSSINKFIEELDIQDSVKQLFGRQITEGLPLMLAKKVLSISWITSCLAVGYVHYYGRRPRPPIQSISLYWPCWNQSRKLIPVRRLRSNLKNWYVVRVWVDGARWRITRLNILTMSLRMYINV